MLLSYCFTVMGKDSKPKDSAGKGKGKQPAGGGDDSGSKGKGKGGKGDGLGTCTYVKGFILLHLFLSGTCTLF